MNEIHVIRIHYWAAARSAAGCAGEDLSVPAPVSLAELRTLLNSRHAGTRLPEVLAVCSVLVGDRPVSSLDPDDVVVNPGDHVEFLPPFAGG